jgi:hypothetical protein
MMNYLAFGLVLPSISADFKPPGPGSNADPDKKHWYFELDPDTIGSVLKLEDTHLIKYF